MIQLFYCVSRNIIDIHNFMVGLQVEATNVCQIEVGLMKVVMGKIGF